MAESAQTQEQARTEFRGEVKEQLPDALARVAVEQMEGVRAAVDSVADTAKKMDEAGRAETVKKVVNALKALASELEENAFASDKVKTDTIARLAQITAVSLEGAHTASDAAGRVKNATGEVAANGLDNLGNAVAMAHADNAAQSAKRASPSGIQRAIYRLFLR